MHEIALKAFVPRNPFDIALSAELTGGQIRLKVRGFHDGAGTWRIRFSLPT